MKIQVFNHQHIEIPPPWFKCKGVSSLDQGITKKLSELAVGSSVKIPMKHRSGLWQIARNLGFKITTRSMGSKETITVYRTL